MSLKVWFRCVGCGIIFPSSSGYNLKYLFGNPQQCPNCRTT
jgi:hypothetical protein